MEPSRCRLRDRSWAAEFVGLFAFRGGAKTINFETLKASLVLHGLNAAWTTCATGAAPPRSARIRRAIEKGSHSPPNHVVTRSQRLHHHEPVPLRSHQPPAGKPGTALKPVAAQPRRVTRLLFRSR
jgi:hypothetical protein